MCKSIVPRSGKTIQLNKENREETSLIQLPLKLGLTIRKENKRKQKPVIKYQKQLNKDVMSTVFKCPSIYGTPKRLPYQRNYVGLIVIEYTMYE
ncbi:hypothetical protein TcasGA2_TC031302 [Tribolium castaneum]|uniref:Uncharacterized protein n=1 Tax=Tribolium castaneum TaxID=7070 RepID=A0A139WA55_TRICA|nr:hypothetical protein TcasGA2_TC031302 [Tribolium castaneum]